MLHHKRSEVKKVLEGREEIGKLMLAKNTKLDGIHPKIRNVD